MPDIIADAADIDDQIAVARETLRELIEQAAAYSGAADDDLVAQRIADQEARIELMTERREKFCKAQTLRSNGLAA
jgi:hypothetical protein